MNAKTATAQLATVGGEPADDFKSPKDGGGHRYAESGRLVINTTSAVVRLQPRFAASKLGTRARERARQRDSLMLIVFTDAAGREMPNRILRPLSEVEFTTVFTEPGAYEAHGLLITGASTKFADANLKKTDPETGDYKVTLIDMVDDKPQLRKLSELTHCIPFQSVEFELGEAQFVDHVDSRFNRWVDLWWKQPPSTRLSKWIRVGIACSVQPFAMAAYMIGQDAILLANGIRHSVLFRSRGFDWGALFSPSYHRALVAGHPCEPFTQTRFTKDGNPEVQADFYTIFGAPILWWPMVLAAWFMNGGLVTLFSTGSIWPEHFVWFVITSALLITASAAAFLRVIDNDNDVLPFWQYALNNFGRFLRNLRLSRLPGMRELNLGDDEASVVDALSKRSNDEVEKSFSPGIRLNLWLNRHFSRLLQPVYRKPAAESEE